MSAITETLQAYADDDVTFEHVKEFVRTFSFKAPEQHDDDALTLDDPRYEGTWQEVVMALDADLISFEEYEVLFNLFSTDVEG